jgi:hypothetical protein
VAIMMCQSLEESKLRSIFFRRLLPLTLYCIAEVKVGDVFRRDHSDNRAFSPMTTLCIFCSVIGGARIPLHGSCNGQTAGRSRRSDDWLREFEESLAGRLHRLPT